MVAICEATALARPNGNPLHVYGRARGRHPCNHRRAPCNRQPLAKLPTPSTMLAIECATQNSRDEETKHAEDLAVQLLVDQHSTCSGLPGPDLACTAKPIALEMHAVPKAAPPAESRDPCRPTTTPAAQAATEVSPNSPAKSTYTKEAEAPRRLLRTGFARRRPPATTRGEAPCKPKNCPCGTIRHGTLIA
jgi:hypothetical protein